MNKQQLANKIWESANKMRSKIEANEYKDYILGFIFYKFLSDKEVDFLKKDGYEEADLQEHVHENNEELVDYCQQHLGYFIAYDNLFSTWLDKGNGTCRHLDEKTSLCLIYEDRPEVCRVDLQYDLNYQHEMSWSKFCELNQQCCFVLQHTS